MPKSINFTFFMLSSVKTMFSGLRSEWIRRMSLKCISAVSIYFATYLIKTRGMPRNIGLLIYS